MTRMKESANLWVKTIPNDWQEMKLRYLVNLRSEKAKTTDSNVYVGMENIISNIGEYVPTEIQVDNAENISFNKGDILFGKLRPYLRKYWLATFSGTASSEFLVFKESALNKKFLYWMIQSDSFINDVDSSTYGSKMPRASWDYIRNIVVPFPSSDEEQNKIADFLDKKVTQLDKAKSLLEEQIQKLAAYRQSLIYETVTKGLDKTAPMKDSGVDWIGQVPEGWGVTKVSNYFIEVKNKNIGNREDNLLSLSYGSIKRKSNTNLMGLLPESFETYNIIEANDIVFRLTDLQNDKKSLRTGLSLERGLITSAYVTIRAINKQTNSKYYHYLFHAYDICKVFYSFGGGVRQGGSFSDLSELQIVLPNVEEQLKIADFLDQKISQINQMIDIKQKQIENINQQRQTLIYDYVTGKRRV